MNNIKDYITVRITGQYNGHPISRMDYDISEVSEILGVLSNLFSIETGNQKDKLPVDYLDGSIMFRMPATKMRCAVVSAMLATISLNFSLDGIEKKAAEQIEWMQQRSKKTGVSFDITTTEPNANLTISPTTTYQRIDSVWCDVELYLYGIIVRAGGKGKALINLQTDEYGLLSIGTDKDTLRDVDENLLYHECGVWARGKQNINTDELTSLVLIELLDYTSKYNDAYLKECIKRATPAWAGVSDINKWLNKVRGYE